MLKTNQQKIINENPKCKKNYRMFFNLVRVLNVICRGEFKRQELKGFECWIMIGLSAKPLR